MRIKVSKDTTMSMSSPDLNQSIDIHSTTKHDVPGLYEIEEDEDLKQTFAKNGIPEGRGGGTVRSTVHSSDRRITSPSDKSDFKKVGHKNPSNRPLKFTWKKGQVIGEGSFGRVYKGINDSTGPLSLST